MYMCVHWSHLSHMYELCEDLGSLLCCVSVQDHKLHPLRDTVTQHYWALQSRVVPHGAMHHITAIVQKLWHRQDTHIHHTEHKAVTVRADVTHNCHPISHNHYLIFQEKWKAYWDVTEVPELQFSKEFGHVIWLHVVKEQWDFSLFHRGRWHLGCVCWRVTVLNVKGKNTIDHSRTCMC